MFNISHRLLRSFATLALGLAFTSSVHAQTVALTSPAHNSTYTTADPITFSASVTGTVTRVRYKKSSGIALIGSSTVAPAYVVTDSIGTAGTYQITAEALNGAGNVVATSAARTVTITASTNAAPTVSLTAPSNGASQPAPATFTLTASAADSDGTIASVKFYDGATLLNTDTTSPYSYSYGTSVAGSHSLTAVATDNAGATTTSAAVSVSVISGSNAAPTVSLASTPTSGGTATNFDLTATASDTDGTITDVKFYDGANLLATDNSAPYKHSFITSVTGNHSLTAVATDNAGASTTSAAVNVTVTDPTTLSVTRRYVYDAGERLCKTIDPEAGATVIDYDASGNIAWTASGLNLPSTVSCDRTDPTVDAAKIIRTYDAMNRLLTVETPNHAADVTTTYTPDGLVASLVATNGPAGAHPATTTYAYNKRRLLTAETSAQATYVYALEYGYDNNAHLSWLKYPDMQVVTYAPDALGRPTEVRSGAQMYASAIAYYANGAISGFKYGNDVLHSMTQNARGLPSLSKDVKGATKVLEDAYAYDANGNVTDITDQARNGLTTRGMGYDKLDRLTAALSPQQWGDATYSYDAIDNIRTASQQTPARSFTYTYDSVSNRLTGINGTSSISFGYDANGNVTSKGAQLFTFDPSNRMTTAALLDGSGVQTYRYDGTGRRVQTTDPSGAGNLWVYSQSGQVLYNHDERRGLNVSYIYLGNTQVATRSVNYNVGTTGTIGYQHTDALGSPVAESDATGAVTKRNSYSPYGEAYGTTSIDGTGYTGHVMDHGTGLIYMQQRYYDPTIGRFSSIDPALVEFNRYSHARNSPYRFIDLDGRAPKGAGDGTREPDQNDTKEKPKGCGVTRDCVRIGADGKWTPVPSRTTALAMIEKTLKHLKPSTNGAAIEYKPEFSGYGTIEGDSLIVVGPSAFRYLGMLGSTIEHEGVHIGQRSEKGETYEAEAWAREVKMSSHFKLSPPDLATAKVMLGQAYDYLPSEVRARIKRELEGAK